MKKRYLHLRRTFALMLSLVMSLSLLSAAAFADGENAASYVRVGSETLKDGDSSAAGTAVYEDGILTLNNYNGGRIATYDGDLTIRVVGTNRVNALTAYTPGIYSAKNLLIYGEGDDASLSIHGNDTALETYRGSLVVRDLASLSCTSTSKVNPVITDMFGPRGMEFSNIGTMLVRGITTYSMVFSDAPIKFDRIGTLEILSDKSTAVSAHGGLDITGCGSVLLVSKTSPAVYGYANRVNIEAEHLIAVGSTAITVYYDGSSVDLSKVGAMYLSGQSRAVDPIYDRSPVTYPEGAVTSADKKTCILAPNGLTETEITISDTEKVYDGQPIAVTADAESGGETMTYIYSWYDEAGNDPLMEAPTDAGTYLVRVDGFSDTYYSDFRAPKTAKVTISPAAHDDADFESSIGNGSNVYDLPAIPDGMRYGAPFDVSDELTATVGGRKLHVEADSLVNGSEYTVTIPVEPDTSRNYISYDIICTLTAEIEYPRFDLCDGSDIIADSYDAPSTDDAWADSQDTADEFGYTFEGWYTAPNGWGTKVADENGTLLPEYTEFEDGVTYFAHYVATRAIAGYVRDDIDAIVLAYVSLNDDEVRTVYTTGLDFTQAEALGAHVSGDGYTYQDGTLTLSGVMINSGISGAALTLPDDTDIVLNADPALADKTTYYTKEGYYIETEPSEDERAYAYNNLRGGSDSIPALDAKGDLSISAGDSSGCSLSLRGSQACIAGDLTMSGATLTAPVINVAGNADVGRGAMLLASDTDGMDENVQLFVAKDLTGSESIIYSNGALLVNGDIDLSDLVLLVKNEISATNLTLNSIVPMSICGSISCEESITLVDSFLGVMGNISPCAVYTSELTVSSDSRLEVYDYQTCGVAANSMTVSASTVDISNESGGSGSALMLSDAQSEASLTLDGVRITAPKGAAITKTAGIGLTAAVDGQTCDTLKIEPYDPPKRPSGGGSPTPTYTITVSDTENGTITASRGTVTSGSTVTVTVTPDGGYLSDSVTVTDASGERITLTPAGDGVYTFEMPESSVTVSGEFRLRFTDLDPNAWYFDSAAYCLKNGLMDGVGQTLFAPDGTVTRAQLVTILYRLEKQPTVNYAMSFTDVADDTWYTEAVRWAASEKLVDGITASTFAPSAPLTREQLVTVLYRYAQYKGYDVSVGENTNILSYDDAFDIADYAVSAMQWACGSGLINGTNGMLMPKSDTSRAQIAAILQRFGEL